MTMNEVVNEVVLNLSLFEMFNTFENEIVNVLNKQFVKKYFLVLVKKKETAEDGFFFYVLFNTDSVFACRC